MIIESKSINDKHIFKADLCLIGSGPANLTIVHHLRNTKLKIIIIPGGKFNSDKQNQSLYKGIIGKNSSHEPLLKNRHREFGGSGNYWGGRCVPLDEIDFNKRKWIKYSGWPFKLKEIKKFYNKASIFLNVSAYDFNTNFYKKYINPIIQKIEDNYLSSKKLESWSPILNFKKKLNNTIKKDHILIINNSHLLKIEAGSNNINNIKCKILNKTFYVVSKNYVLGCGGIENPRILLNSKNKFHPNGLGNSNDLVGRFYMAHHAGIFVNMNPTDRENIDFDYFKGDRNIYLRNRWWFSENFQKIKKIGNSIFYLSHTSKSKDMGAHGELFDIVSLFKKIILNKKSLLSLKLILGLSKKLFNIKILIYLFKLFYLRLQKNRIPSILPNKKSKYFGIYFQIEQTPCFDSRLKLNKKKDRFGLNLIELNLKFNKIDVRTFLETHNYIITKIKENKIALFQKNYDRKILNKMFKQKLKKFNSMAHHIGTTRMSSSKKFGVVDKNLKVYGVNNLYVVGSSTFPTGGHANPTYTIVALSIKLAEHLKKVLKND
ncbi:GMC family oxidoreductase [Candidatus Pelagibacter ubique]|nr:GMC family oxidoreductase [Candidatus Pelagibacter ubique]